MEIKMNEMLKKANNAVNIAKEMIEKTKQNTKTSEIKKRIEEHKYNIGKMIYDNEIEVDNGFVVSNINSIDRLIEEINQLGGKSNG